MKIKLRNLTVFCAMAASVALLGTAGSARADQWFVMGEQAIKAADSSVEIKTQGNRWQKDVKQVRLAVEGADVQIMSVVLGWDNRKDDTITNIGTLKSGGQTAPTDAPGRKGRLKFVKIQYKIVGKAEMANVKILGFD